VELGKGAFSVVKVGHHKQSNESYAIKIITKSEMQDFDKACLKEEIGILSELRHDHIIRLYDVFEEDSYIHLILEKVDGGHLLDRLIAKEEYTECECRDVLKIVVEAVRHCHEHKIAHRDLKPENLLLMDDDCDISIKIADFGFAKVVPEGDTLTTQLGSAMHVAPEILTKTPYGTKIDMVRHTCNVCIFCVCVFIESFVSRWSTTTTTWTTTTIYKHTPLHHNYYNTT